jgi:Xaa-Pro aminopeptidase
LKNYEHVRREMNERCLDAFYVSSGVNRLYVSGFASSDGVVLITPQHQYFFTDSRYIEAASRALPDFRVERTDAENTYNRLIMRAIEAEDIKSLAFEEKSVSYSDHQTLSGALPVVLQGAQSILTDLRAVKSETEIEKMIRAQRIAEEAFENTLGVIRPGMTEKEVAAELIYSMLKLGADGLSFDPIVVGGARSSMPHGVPTDAEIKTGTFLTMDFGCIKDGYCSDMTRTVAVGGYTDEMRAVYETVLRAQESGIEKAAAGVPGSAVHAAAADVIGSAGFGAYFGHGFGHGLGLEVHECNSASPSDSRELKAGNVISAEPGIYLPGRFGVRIEDVIVIRDGGCENITRTPKRLLVI